MKEQIEKEKLRLMVFQSAKELGEKVDKHLLDKYGLDSEQYTFIVPIKENFFEDGHFKVEIEETVRGKDLFLLTDIGNYSIEYTMHGFINHTSPQDLLMQLKDGINASNCHAKSINIVMPLLYAGRQHRRNTRESLACGAALREIDNLSRIKSFITFDAHDQGVEHAVQNMEFDNFYVTNTILDEFIKDLSIEELKNLVFIAPDTGATGRRNVYLNSFASPYINREAGGFIKQRDYNNLVNGKYPVVSHDYFGNGNLEGRTAIVTDDMISSGGSMFDVIDELKKNNVSKIYLIVTYSLFTRGIDRFEEYYKEGKLDGIYTSNLSYIPKEYQDREWLHICDCSYALADIIYNIHNDLSISSILRDKSAPIKLLEKKFNGNQR
ncbi:MAG: ribose-phosphate diphosphokinase [Bacilli bacterium]